MASCLFPNSSNLYPRAKLPTKQALVKKRPTERIQQTEITDWEIRKIGSSIDASNIE